MRASQRKNLLLDYLADGPHTSEEVRTYLAGISPATLCRLVSSMEGKVLQLGKARATIYARPREIRESGFNFPVFRVGMDGDVQEIGTLLSIKGGYAWSLSSSGVPKVSRSLPWFIQDMRPDGFIGRAFANRMLRIDISLPERLAVWSDDVVLSVLSRYGDDCMGNLIVGEEAMKRYFAAVHDVTPTITVSSVVDEYPRMAQEAMDGDPAGSSAGGEQPKFTAVVERNGDIANVLVKFSPLMETPGGRRWADLLVCEHLALETIRGAGFSAARSTMVFAGGRAFLEVERFDRIGRFGRSPVNSLGVVDDEFFGHRDNWMNMADRLESTRMVSSQDAEVLRWLSAFGEMIANADMHFGNASLIMMDFEKPTFSLAPAYDMLPMLYRPRDGELTSPQFTPPLVASMSRWEGARQSALQFWEVASCDERISPEFREICARNRETLGITMRGPRLVS